MTGKALVLATAIDDDGTTTLLKVGPTILGEATEVGLVFYNADLIPYETMEQIGRLYGTATRRMQWQMGDWLIAVEDIYPDRYTQAAEATRLSPHTLANRASICRKIPIEERRPGVPFSVHAVVAYLEPAERRKWLARAEKEDWTRAELTEHLNPKLLTAPTATCPTCGQPMKEE